MNDLLVIFNLLLPRRRGNTSATHDDSSAHDDGDYGKELLGSSISVKRFKLLISEPISKLSSQSADWAIVLQLPLLFVCVYSQCNKKANKRKNLIDNLLNDGLKVKLAFFNNLMCSRDFYRLNY